MDLSMFQVLGINPLPIVIIAIITQFLKQIGIFNNIPLTITINKNVVIQLRKIILSLLPLPIAAIICIIFSFSEKHFIILTYLQNILFGWVFSSWAYNIIKRFIPNNNDNDVKKDNQ